MTAHIPKVRPLVLVWASLIVLTGITSAVSKIDLGEWNVVVALIIAVTKASLVAWIFMGVRYTTTLTKLFVVAGLVWLGIMLLITASDYKSRNWTYQGQPWSQTKTVGGSH
ncbi:MAG: cytochrome C oxidase subunit IV family protein [Acidobacteriaceae bacterium]|nr:cytochrome C oxidase subunit IV family protein [Acidobacteriaceae bacterium]MBV9782115.1 cytochrome C oxidase subunit IV family protein [Acidobacteriaceae bacterium]